MGLTRPKEARVQSKLHLSFPVALDRTARRTRAASSSPVALGRSRVISASGPWRRMARTGLGDTRERSGIVSPPERYIDRSRWHGLGDVTYNTLFLATACRRVGCRMRWCWMCNAAQAGTWLPDFVRHTIVMDELSKAWRLKNDARWMYDRMVQTTANLVQTKVNLHR